MSKADPKLTKEKIAELYKFADLSSYSFRRRLSIRAIDLVSYIFINILGKTIRFETEGWENFKDIDAAKKAFVGSFWHDCTFTFAYFWRNRGYVSMVSKSFDGEYLARILQRFGCGIIRGSSRDGGRAAFAQMARTLQSGLPINFAIDGPRGPRHITKIGPLLLAKKSGAPVVPFWVEAKSRWITGSWGKLQIPKPFTHVMVFVGAPIYVHPDAEKDELEARREELQKSLDGLVERGNHWRNGEE